MKSEGAFKADLIEEIEETMPGCEVYHIDPPPQGIPDLIVIGPNRPGFKSWATLEGKKSEGAHHQPNQDDFVAKHNDMSFSRFIYPENKDEVLNELREAFGYSEPSKESLMDDCSTRGLDK